MQFKDMVVYGTPVRAETQKKAFEQFLARIKSQGPQTLLVLEAILSKFGLSWATSHQQPTSVAHRTADRILQRARKAGVLIFIKGAWHIHMNQQRTEFSL